MKKEKATSVNLSSTDNIVDIVRLDTSIQVQTWDLTDVCVNFNRCLLLRLQTKQKKDKTPSN